MQLMLSDVDLLTIYFGYYRVVAAILVLVLFIKGSVSLKFLPKAAVIIKTFGGALEDIIYFCMVFILLIIGFSVFIHCVAGNTVLAFSSVEKSIFSCFDILVGSFESDKLQEAGSESVAMLFFYVYNILMVWILINVFIAIISDAYTAAIQETAGSVGFTRLTYSFWLGIDTSLDKIIDKVNKAIQCKRYAQMLSIAYQAQYEYYAELLKLKHSDDLAQITGHTTDSDVARRHKGERALLHELKRHELPNLKKLVKKMTLDRLGHRDAQDANRIGVDGKAVKYSTFDNHVVLRKHTMAQHRPDPRRRGA
jgi:hypothetical protein